MSKMSNLDLVLDEMVTAGHKMIEAATALREMFSEMEKTEAKNDCNQGPSSILLLLRQKNLSRNLRLKLIPSRRYAESWLVFQVKA